MLVDIPDRLFKDVVQFAWSHNCSIRYLRDNQLKVVERNDRRFRASPNQPFKAERTK